MSDNLQETIRESAKAPAKASGDAGSVEQHKLTSRSLLTSIWPPRRPPLNRSVAFDLTSSCHRCGLIGSQLIELDSIGRGVGLTGD